MRFAKTSGALLTVAVALLAAAGVQGQGQPPAKPQPATQAKPGAAPAKPAAAPTKSASAAPKAATPGGAAKPPQSTAAKPAATKPKAAKPAKASKGETAAAKAAPATTAANAAPEEKKIEVEGKRDPFVPLLASEKSNLHLPPGKAGLVIGTVRVDGAVRSPNGMIAVVSNPEQRVYFVREGDRLYDGNVETIGLDGVTFREMTKDAFGKPVERVVTKRIYATAGEQQ